MYGGVWRSLSWVKFLEWPTYNGESSLTETAARVVEEAGITSGDVVGGSSLGGMVALEIAKVIDVAGVILIGSATRPAEISRLLRMLAPLAAISPFGLTQTVAGKIGDSRALEMYQMADPRFIRAMCQALPSWEGFRGPPEVLHRIHGDSDHIIPVPEGTAHVVSGAGHLLAITHPDECVEFVKGVRERLRRDPAEGSQLGEP